MATTPLVLPRRQAGITNAEGRQRAKVWALGDHRTTSGYLNPFDRDPANERKGITMGVPVTNSLVSSTYRRIHEQTIVAVKPIGDIRRRR